MRRAAVGALIAVTFACSSSPKPPAEETAKAQNTIAPEDLQTPDYWTESDRRIHADYLFLRAELEAMAGKPQSAVKLYQKSNELHPNGFVAWKNLLAGIPDESSADSLLKGKKLVLQYPKNEYLRTTYGSLLAKQGLYRDATRQFEKAIAFNPEHVDAYLHLIEVHRVQKDKSKALKVAKRLVAKVPQAAEGWAALAKLYLSAGTKSRALFTSRRAFDLQSRNPEYMLLYALSLELNGNSKAAVSLYEKLFRLNPNNEELITKMVRLYRQIGSLEDALALLEEAMKSKGGSKSSRSALLLQKSFILWELERFKESSELLVNLAKDNPKSNRINYLAGLGKEKIQKPSEALPFYRKVEVGSDFYPHARYRSVNIYRSQKKYQKALNEAYAALDSDDNRSADFYLVIAHIYEDMGKVPRGVAILKKGVTRYDKSASLHFNLGVLYEKQGNVDGCIAQMKKVIQLDDKHSAAYNYLGYLYAENGRNLAEAEKLVSKALELKPNDGYYLDSLGWVYYKQNRLDMALKTLLKANELIPKEGVILEHIGDVYLAQNNLSLALKYYRSATKTELAAKDRKRIESKYRKASKSS